MHLGDHVPQPAVAVVAPKDAQRVEDIAEDPCLQQRGNRALRQDQILIGEEGAEPVTQRAVRRLARSV